MRVLKLFVLLNIIVIVLAGLVYFAVTQFEWNSFDKDSAKEEKQVAGKTNGVVLDSLIQPSLEGNLFAFSSGAEEQKITEYMLSSGREKVFSVMDSMSSYVTMSGEYIYWVE